MIKKCTLSFSVLCLAVSSNVIAEPVSLTGLYKDTLRNNPHLAHASLATENAQKKQDQVGSLYKPQIDAGLQYGGLRNDWTTLTETDGQGASASITLGQNLYNSELNAASTLAEKQVSLYSVSYDAALDGMRLQVADGYFSALKAQEVLKQTQATQSAIEEHLKQTKNRFKNGLIAENDVKEAQAQFDLASASVIFAENAVEKALDNLYALSGQDYSGVIELNLSQADTSQMKPEGFNSWEEKAQLHSPQMKVQKELVSLAKSQISLAEAGHMPSLGLLAEYRYAFATKSRTTTPGAEKGSMLDYPDNATFFAGVALNLPLYRGGATTDKVEQAQIQYQQSLQLQEKAWREVTRNIRSTEKDMQALTSAKRAYAQAVHSAESALAATQQGFDIGTRTIVDVLNATHQLYTARQNLAETEINYLLSALNLKFLGGALNESDILAIDSLGAST